MATPTVFLLSLQYGMYYSSNLSVSLSRSAGAKPMHPVSQSDSSILRSVYGFNLQTVLNPVRVVESLQKVMHGSC